MITIFFITIGFLGPHNMQEQANRSHSSCFHVVKSNNVVFLPLLYFVGTNLFNAAILLYDWREISTFFVWLVACWFFGFIDESVEWLPSDPHASFFQSWHHKSSSCFSG